MAALGAVLCSPLGRAHDLMMMITSDDDLMMITSETKKFDSDVRAVLGFTPVPESKP